ncbi:MAG: large conductance mechanosensitive channel protein MscL [Verrucomicrobiaceae bacterium]|nr:large conductance mechanosensitive channel protein MscL [Verrucomicrobiaceae bacterium]
MSLISEFKEFALKGNVIDLAVGVVIGGAFGKLVDGVVNGVINPVVGIVTGKGAASALLDGVWNLGSGVLNFLLLAAVVFFVFVKPMNKLKAMTEKKKEESPPAPPADVVLLTEIRDLLKK